MNESITLIIPAYQEEASIAAVLDEIQSVFKANQLNIPIIVVDDGSTDKTGEIALSKGVRVIHHDENRGYGASLKTGIRKAETEFVMIIDADGTYPPDMIPPMIKHLDIYDMVVGARDWSPPSRVLAKWILLKLANYLAQTKIPDLNSGMRVIRKSLVEKYWNLLPNGFSFTTTITLSLLCSGYAVKFIPIKYRHRGGQSKIRPIHNTIQFLNLIVKTIVYFNPLRIFLPVGVGFCFLGIGIGFYSKFFLGKLMDVTTITTFTSGIEIALMGFLADLVVRRFK